MTQPEIPSPRRFLGIPIRLDFIAATLFGMAALAAYSVYLGKDANYDLRNYHYYGCYCLLNGRVTFDIWASQFGSYLNPVGYLPFCWAVDHLRPILVGLLFGAIHGISFGLLYALAWTLLPGATPRRRIGLSLLTAVAGIFSPLFLSLVGTSITDAWTPIFVLASLLAVLHAVSSASWPPALVAGLATGFVLGVKGAVNGVFAVALFAALCTTRSRPGYFRRIAAYWAGLVPAALAVGWSWGATLSREFGNPFFPFLNNIYRSPYFPAYSFTDPRWKATTLAQALEYPLHWAAEYSSLSSEARFRDLRFAVFVLLLLPALAVGLGRLRKSAGQASASTADGAATTGSGRVTEPRPCASEPRPSGSGVVTEPRPSGGGSVAEPRPTGSGCTSFFAPLQRRVVLWFFTLAYLLWLYNFGHMRYATPLELLLPLAILALCDLLFDNRSTRLRTFAVLAVLGIVWVRPATWGRRPWTDTWFEVAIPHDLQTANTLYVMPDSALSACLAPFLPADSRFVRIAPADRFVPPDRYLGPRIVSVIQHHTGPIRILAGGPYDKAHLAAYGVSVRNDDCLPVRTYADNFTVCSAYRTAEGASSAVLLSRTAGVPQAAIVYRHELLLNPDFRNGLDSWDTGGTVDLLPAEHAVRVTVVHHAHQSVKVTPGASYRLLVRARCEQPDTELRLQCGWYDAQGNGLSASGEKVACTSEWDDYSTIFQAPPNAASGMFYLTSHTDKPVLFQHASMAY